MTAFTSRNSSHLGVDKIATATTAQALYDNLKAVLEKDATAVAAGWVLANSYVVEAMLAAGAVAQAKLKTALNTIQPGANGPAQAILSGGQYCFAPTLQIGAGSGTDEASVYMGGAIDTAGGTALTPWQDGTAGNVSTNYAATTTRSTELTFVSYYDLADDLVTINVRYVTASPPYDLGEGSVPVFVFLQLDKSGNLKQVWMAEDPPWGHNGPTKIDPHFVDKDGKNFRVQRPPLTDLERAALRDPALRAGLLASLRASPFEIVEVTNELKNRDMPLIPHPFASRAPDDVVVMVPVCDLLHDIALLHNAGENIARLIKGGYLTVSNEPLDRAAPPGVQPVEIDWKLTG